MKLNITTWQRVKLSQIVGEQGGQVEAIAVYMPIWTKLNLGDEDKAYIGWHINPAGNAAWNPENSNTRWELDFTEEEMKLLRLIVGQYRGWLVGNREQIIDLFRELEIDHGLGE